MQILIAFLALGLIAAAAHGEQDVASEGNDVGRENVIGEDEIGDEDTTIQRVHPGSSGGFVDHFYTHRRANVGQFPGELVCLEADLSISPDAEKCGIDGYVYALSLMSGSKVYPLLAASKQADDRLNAPGMLGERVVVHGKFYPNFGMIVTDKIWLESEKPEVSGLGHPMNPDRE